MPNWNWVGVDNLWRVICAVSDNDKQIGCRSCRHRKDKDHPILLVTCGVFHLSDINDDCFYSFTCCCSITSKRHSKSFFFFVFFLYSDWAGSINYRSVRLKVGRMGDHLSHVLMVASQLANKISAIFYIMEKYIVHRRFNIKTHPLETGCVY